VAQVVVVTGAGAGVGRAVVEEFARQGWKVALLSRDAGRLEQAATQLRDRYGACALPVSIDVAEADAVDVAASRVEQELGPIHTWVNVAMATVFAPVSSLSPEEVRRGTHVTYLGAVHGMMTALRLMRARNRGVIVNVGSALAYRSVPLQAIYCGAKAAIRGFTDSLRSEIIHDKLAIQLTTVDLPALNTPQFDWALNKTGKRPQPVPPISSRKWRLAPSTSRLPTGVATSGSASRRSRPSWAIAWHPGCWTVTWPRLAIPVSSPTRINPPTLPRTCLKPCPVRMAPMDALTNARER
jgi:short-subunit dehydrogenase